MFAQDVAESRPIDLARWRDRPWTNRVKEWSARFGAYWL
jgi:cardiolipin synthase